MLRGAVRKERMLFPFAADLCPDRSNHHTYSISDAPFGDELFPLALLGFHGVTLFCGYCRPHTRSPVNSPLFRLQWPAGGTGRRRSPLLLSVGCIHDLSPCVGVWQDTVDEIRITRSQPFSSPVYSTTRKPQKFLGALLWSPPEDDRSLWPDYRTQGLSSLLRIVPRGAYLPSFKNKYSKKWTEMESFFHGHVHISKAITIGESRGYTSLPGHLPGPTARSGPCASERAVSFSQGDCWVSAGEQCRGRRLPLYP